MTNVSLAPASPALAALLAEAEAAGLRLRATAGGKLAIAGAPSPVLLTRLRANRDALVALLRAPPAAAGAAGVAARAAGEEVERLRKACGERLGRHPHHDGTMTLIAYRHGLRVTELVGLRWDMLDLDQGLLHVRRLKQGREIASELTGQGLPPDRCEAYDRPYDQHPGSHRGHHLRPAPPPLDRRREDAPR